MTPASSSAKLPVERATSSGLITVVPSVAALVFAAATPLALASKQGVRLGFSV